MLRYGAASWSHLGTRNELMWRPSSCQSSARWSGHMATSYFGSSSEPPASLTSRRAFLIAALSFLSLEPAPPVPALAALHRYMDSWAGIGRVVVALDRDGHRL